MSGDVRSWLTAGFLLLATACAQDADQSLLEPAAPAAELQVGKLRSGTWVYEVRRQGGTTNWRETYRLMSESYRWLSVNIRETAPDNRWSVADTMHYSQDLRPLRQAYHILKNGQDWRIVENVYDSTTVHMTSDYIDYRTPVPQRRNWASRIASVPSSSAPMVSAIHEPDLVYLMQRVPLAAGWSGAVQRGPIGSATFVQTSLRVVGEERVGVPAGDFDCWRVTMGPGASDFHTLWVSKAERLLVRSRLGPEGQGLEWVLTSFTPEPE